MRILHVTDTYLPRLGGIELHVSDLVARQFLAGHEVAVLTREPAGADTTRSRVPIVRLQTSPTGLGIADQIGRQIRHFAPDVVHAHLSVGSPFTWAVLRYSTGVPTLASMHSLLPARPLVVRVGIWMTGIPRDHVTFTAVSAVAASRLRGALGRNSQVHVLHNGVDPAAWTVAHRPTRSFNIVAVGRLAARKRPIVLVDALARLARAAPHLDWNATLVGDGPQRAMIAAESCRAGLAGRIALPGAMPRDGIRQVLGGADVFVAPAKLESFGIAALEARCAGIPVIGMDRSGVTEFITHNRDGLLATCDAEIASHLLRLATEPRLAAEIRLHNTNVPVPMAWTAVLHGHDAMYNMAIADSARTRVRRRLAIVTGSTS